ncbi:hypothetical protein [Hydrogenovibrio marinus]|uniref:Uncharacterized protein n=1 Tax=Hydrogenovibrio marinus TaxID=28885 RepID=A0A066ZR33_HYDMR|nr:hypothetical protein [Hydrogenovibrio marinus]KDN94694.1 hypothetical protein EI16_12405 [Hydrogenovibrio marinus]
MHSLIKIYAKPALERAVESLKKDLREIDKMEQMGNGVLKPGYYDDKRAELENSISEHQTALTELEAAEK